MIELTDGAILSLMTGIGNPDYDKAAGMIYTDRLLGDQELLNAYRNTGLARKIVDIPALDAFRRWRDWQADAEQITKIENEEKRLNLQTKMIEGLRNARLWGGNAVYIGMKDKRPAMELIPEKVNQGDLLYLTVIPRRELSPGELNDDPTSEDYGKPIYYEVTNGKTLMRIHPSRLVRFIGNPHPDPWLAPGATYGWGDSVLQSVFTDLQNMDGTAANIASLVFEANVDVFSIPRLMEQFSNKVYRDKLMNRLREANMGKGIARALVRDSEEEYERISANFAGLPDVLEKFMTMVSAAADIPMTRLFGTSAKGLSATGEGDMKNYYDKIETVQSLELTPAMNILDKVLIRSALGAAASDEIFYTWAELEQMSEKEKAEIGKSHADTAAVLINTGLFMGEELREVVGNQMIETGFYPGLADKLKENGNELPEFDLERRTAEANTTLAEKTAKEGPKPKTPTKDAAPRTLYVYRPVLNGEAIAQHYKDQGVTAVYDPSSMHVTIVYSKQPLDWMKIDESWEKTLTVVGGARLTEKFGPEENVLVLLFKSGSLDYRHQSIMEAGASDDWGDYQSHISISIEGAELDISKIEPWKGPIEFGPEVWEEIDLDGDWTKKVKTS